MQRKYILAKKICDVFERYRSNKNIDSWLEKNPTKKKNTQ